jgi:hypothetical protein
VVNAEWVDASAVEIVVEIRGHEKESFGIGEVLASGKKEERKQNGGGFEEKPSQRWRDCETPF